MNAFLYFISSMSHDDSLQEYEEIEFLDDKILEMFEPNPADKQQKEDNTIVKQEYEGSCSQFSLEFMSGKLFIQLFLSIEV